MKTLQAIHTYEDSPSTRRFHHRTELHEGFEHLFLHSVVMGRIRLQKSQGGAE
jgi:hypothetical protein